MVSAVDVLACKLRTNFHDNVESDATMQHIIIPKGKNPMELQTN